MDEMILINAARQGDLDAFNQLVLAYQDVVFHQAVRLLGSSDAAEDFTQDAFISAYRNISEFRGDGRPGSFRAWLLRIVTYASYDELRRRKRRPQVPLNPVDTDDDEMESPAWLADSSPSPEDWAERYELRRTLQRYLDELPEDQRAVLVLVDSQGLDYSEAAEVLSVPLGTVKSRLARARLRMKERLQAVNGRTPAPVESVPLFPSFSPMAAYAPCFVGCPAD